MSSDFKLDVVTQHDSEEPGLSTTISSKLLDEKANTVHTIFNGIREQGKLPMNNFATSAERRALNDRCETNLLFLHFFIHESTLFIYFIFCASKFLYKFLEACFNLIIL